MSISLKKRLSAIARLLTMLLFGSALHTQAAMLILDNNFDSVTLDTYDGPTGEAFGTAALLGNATGHRTTAVSSGTGAGASQGMTIGDNNPPAIRSRAAYDTTQTTSFSTYFKKGADNSNVNNIVVFGWATTSGTDNVNAFSGGLLDRFLIGVKATSSTEQNYQFSSTTAIRDDQSTALSGTPSFGLTTGNWYQLSFDLSYNSTDTDWDVTDILLRDWGTDGATVGSTVASLASVNDISLNGIANGYAYLAGQENAGFTAMDNVNVTAIPEPSTLALFFSALAATAIFRRRKS